MLGDERNAHKILIGRPEKKRLLEKTGHRWNGYIKMIFKKKKRMYVDWIHLVQNRGQ
jgi:hypothetical protein